MSGRRWCIPYAREALILAATACIAFFNDLDIVSNLLSISTLFVFMLNVVV
jgi:APA family basic amino acid/polyamine antiporter